MAQERKQLDMPAVRAAIDAIRNVDVRTVEIDQIKDLLLPLFTGFSLRAPVLNPGVPLFRARVIQDRPAHRRDLLYPPASVAPLGRANRPGQPLLYCASAREATYAELQPAQGDIFVLSEWRTTAPLLVNHVGFAKHNLEQLGASRPGPYWSDVEGAGYSPGNAEVAGFLASLFSAPVAPNEADRYKLTVAVAEKLLDSDMFNGLLYPSVAAQATYDNLAIKPAFVDASVEFVRAGIGRIRNRRSDAWEVEFTDTAGRLGADGLIQWRGRLEQWVLSGVGATLTLTAENGRWVARDPSGRVVEPD